ncbi:MAG: tripartite tricarboxylate transporter permease [Methylobacterium sp.]|jgi:TctA family transporter|nr:tripartite tricarboxylate transporter permease [Methylobacterium sp.]MCA3601725.1 tripartite tricarboxylate transporter permease [Methylobacterium sp.]MCA3610697.1 tripartite tricarboxylate transporter permease [Methylobacterium sp.]MCA3618405.1 tripartite tricarboxylate transporter permease [Methylobacterium sp.]MCA3622221.1 tripartite tricarboxylate transporter permease [Methylobacterium sp.]
MTPDILWQAALLVFRWDVMAIILASAAFGMFVGAMPGLTATMATALLVPVTFFLDPVPALGAIVTATAMAIFAGDIPAALLRMPGTPASAAYTDESYLMGKKGQLDLNLGVNLVTSVLGGLIGVAILVLAAPVLAEFALAFSSFEYFWLAALGLTCAVFLASENPLKGFVSLFLGLGIGTIGIDPAAGFPRFTFGSVELMQGVSFIPAMIGMFAISELLRGVTQTGATPEMLTEKIGDVFRGVWSTLKRYQVNFWRGSGVGVVIGALPGAGADIAAWISYALSKRFSKEPQKFGTGHVEGIVDAGAANNSALAAAWIPALVFGIPGDSITAIVIGVLYMKGMNPGPTVFLQNPQLIYAVFLIFVIANLLMLPLGWAAIKSAKQVLRVPKNVLLPLVLLFCVVGSYAMTNSTYGILIMLIMGVFAFVLEENGFPVAPIILGLVLGEMFEQNFMTSMIKADGSFLAFFARPIAAILGIATLAIWGVMLLRAVRLSQSPR